MRKLQVYYLNVVKDRIYRHRTYHCTLHFVALIILTGSYPPKFNAAFCLNKFLIQDGSIAVENEQ